MAIKKYFEQREQLDEVLDFLEKRSKELKKIAKITDSLQLDAISKFNMGEARGIDFSVLAIKKFVIKTIK
jgi:hypothetical protein